MKQIVSTITEECAEQILHTFPLVMRTLGAVMQQRHATELSIQQFRALMIIKHHEGASLSLVAEHLGASLSASSKLIDGLVERRYLSRQVLPEDRRRMVLALTPEGKAKLDALMGECLHLLSDKLAALSEDECRTIIQVMARLAGAMAGTHRSP